MKNYQEVLKLANLETIIFFDMDGVLADFEKGLGGDFANMYKEGFFRNLPVMEQGLNESIQKIKEQGYTVKILSKACVTKSDSRFVKQMVDKANWVKHHIPCIDELDIIIQASDECKGDIVRMYESHECILVDDYTVNLASWIMAGGQGIKKAKRIKNTRPCRQILNVAELAEEGI